METEIVARARTFGSMKECRSMKQSEQTVQGEMLKLILRKWLAFPWKKIWCM